MEAELKRTAVFLSFVGIFDVPSSFPISYVSTENKYIAVVVGNGGAQARTWTSLVKTIHNPPDGGAIIWVFALPGIS